MQSVFILLLPNQVNIIEEIETSTKSPELAKLNSFCYPKTLPLTTTHILPSNDNNDNFDH